MACSRSIDGMRFAIASRPFAFLVALSACAAPPTALAYGADGHRIAGLVAERMLCADAAQAVEDLGRGEGLAELGLWPDRIRSQARWSHTGPWHYMNIPDDIAIDDYVTPPERDILWAIDDASEALRNTRLPHNDRRDALRFLVHFIVDLHQPLHVGRAGDRGGNRIDVRLDRRMLNLHRFWDTEVVTLTGLTPARYAERLLPVVDEHRESWSAGTPRDWAAESQALRGDVYAFDGPGTRLSDHYIAEAIRVTATRLAQSAVRLAATLNDIFCAAPD